jgi:glycogen synthase
LARELGVAERVEIGSIEAADRAGMAAALSRAALVVLLSEYEAHPIAVVEALALGRPVLVAATSGLRELAERGLARAIPLESTSGEVAAAILDQLERPLAPTSFDLPTWDDCAADILAIYRGIVRSVVPCVS